MKCPDCGGELGAHRKAGRGLYKDLPDLLCCVDCWRSYDPQPDGSLAYVKSRRKFYRGSSQ